MTASAPCRQELVIYLYSWTLGCNANLKLSSGVTLIVVYYY
jgi:hypothetical protein